MILSQLSQYLQTRHCASMTDMAIALQATPEALEPMLHKLIAKGRVRALPLTSTCGHSGCSECKPQDQQLYEWSGSTGNQHMIGWMHSVDLHAAADRRHEMHLLQVQKNPK